jgi:hypothetical protein
MRTSAACVLVSVLPDEIELPLPGADAVRSKTALAARPENSSAQTARAVTEGWVTVMVLPTVRAVTLWAENTNVRTLPLFVTLASRA